MKARKRVLGGIAFAAMVGLVASPAAGGHVPGAQLSVSPSMENKISGIPTPADYFGFEIGDEGKLADFETIKQYFQLIAEKSAEADYEVVDQTTDGDDYPLLRMSSEENLNRLDDILAINNRLADPKALAAEAKKQGVSTDDYARELAKTTVPVYYVEASIHSTEVGTTQGLINVVHKLATEDSDETKKILSNMVVVVVPSANPDGQKMVVEYFNKTAGTKYNRTYPDLYHRYVGHDNNRDWFMYTQKESRTRLGIEQKYRPVVQHYMHQAGTLSPRAWVPPWDEPLSTAIDPKTVTGSNSVGMEAQKDLIAEGLSGVQHDDAYGIMWNADVAGYGSFQGTSVWLSEIASNRDLAYTFEDEKLDDQPATMRNPNPYRATSWTFKQNVDYQVKAALSGMNTVAEDAQDFLYNNLYQFTRDTLDWEASAYAYVVPAEQRDPYAVYEMLNILNLGKVEIERATRSFHADGQKYDRGAYIIRTQQPLGRWVDQLLRIDEYPDSARKCTNGCPLIMPYSETTDNLALFFGVDVKAIDSKFKAKTESVREVVQESVRLPRDPGRKGAYVLSPSSYGLGKIIDALQDEGVVTYRASSKVKVSGETLPEGALLIPSGKKARQTLEQAVKDTALPVHAISKMPKTSAIKLKQNTRVGLVRGANNMPGGWMMWMMDQFGMNYEVVEAEDYNNLSKKFDTIVLAPGITTERLTKGLDTSKYPEEFAWAAGVPDGAKKLKNFVKKGGNLVALGSGSETAISALDLPAKNIRPEDRETFNAPGALLAQTYDVSKPAAWGMPKNWPTWYNNDAVFTVKEKKARVSTYPTKGDLLVSGYAKGTDAIAGGTNIAQFTYGKGNVTIAGGHITFRTWPRASWTVVTNAIYNGAGERVTRADLSEETKGSGNNGSK
ncbi:M14 family zinc carboxypeptidase [Glutamicibacter creatinolyticus]|uniref:M14 family zinc carboxypeptidase n=1 Tax=Glutamicibacter creatinolyticus TaxID=162496 RepID=UPI003217FF1E